MLAGVVEAGSLLGVMVLAGIVEAGTVPGVMVLAGVAEAGVALRGTVLAGLVEAGVALLGTVVERGAVEVVAVADGTVLPGAMVLTMVDSPPETSASGKATARTIAAPAAVTATSQRRRCSSRARWSTLRRKSAPGWKSSVMYGDLPARRAPRLRCLEVAL